MLSDKLENYCTFNQDIREIIDKFDLLFVDWYNYEIIGNG